MKRHSRTRKNSVAILFGWLVLSALCSFSPDGAAQQRTVFYVAHNGSDTFSGRSPQVNSTRTDGPFATLERAREAVRSLKKRGPLPAGGVTVYIRGGDYALSKTFKLDAQDGGTDKSPVVYQAYNNERVRLLGGKAIAGFRPVADPVVRGRVAKAALGRIVWTDLKAQGITDYGELRHRGFGRPLRPAALELFFLDTPMQLARWPNDGWATIASAPEGQQSGKFAYSGDRPRRWKSSEDIWLHGYWTWEWADSHEKVKSIDTEKREIATYEPHGVYGYTAGKRYRVVNVLEELDAPGEWYLDRSSGLLYFWPPKPLEEGVPLVSLIDSVIELENTAHLTFQGIEIGVCRGTAVRISGGSYNRIADATLRNVGTVGVTIEGGIHNGVTGCAISACGDGGVLLAGGDRTTLSPGNNYVHNCRIFNYSRWSMTYRPGVFIKGVGNKITHTLIHDAPHSAILLEGNEHLVEYNEIHHVCMETSDAGAFYMGRDFSQRGNVIRYNYFHDLGNSDVQAVYLDDFTSGTTVYGNVIHAARRGVLIGGGRDNVVQNNIFIDCTPAVHVDARGLTWAKSFFDGTNTTLLDRLNAVSYKKPPYSARYPELLRLYEDNPAAAKGNALLNNISYGGRWLDIRNGAHEGDLILKDNLVDVDPLFVDPRKGNFQLRENSPAYQRGFKRIPLEKIGMVGEGGGGSGSAVPPQVPVKQL